MALAALQYLSQKSTCGCSVTVPASSARTSKGLGMRESRHSAEKGSSTIAALSSAKVQSSALSNELTPAPARQLGKALALASCRRFTAAPPPWCIATQARSVGRIITGPDCVVPEEEEAPSTVNGLNIFSAKDAMEELEAPPTE